MQIKRYLPSPIENILFFAIIISNLNNFAHYENHFIRTRNIINAVHSSSTTTPWAYGDYQRSEVQWLNYVHKGSHSEKKRSGARSERIMLDAVQEINCEFAN